MQITMVSILSQTIRTKTLPIKLRDYQDWMDGKPAQQAFPYLTPEDREFVMTGITAEEWEAHLGWDKSDIAAQEPTIVGHGW